MPNFSAQLVNITSLHVDAIVNAANPTLLGGGGVDGAIHAAAGNGLLAECERFPEIDPGVRCKPGSAVLTGGYRLRARYVIHAVGPVYSEEEVMQCDALLASCYRSCIQLASTQRITSIAFPCISTGAYGFPQARGAQIAVSTVRQALQAAPSVQQVIFACFTQVDLVLYKQHINIMAASRPLDQTMTSDQMLPYALRPWPES
jgi:O-acetyl-ADP-ribose deacetylase (regulator of RNase III)